MKRPLPTPDGHSAVHVLASALEDLRAGDPLVFECRLGRQGFLLAGARRVREGERLCGIVVKGGKKGALIQALAYMRLGEAAWPEAEGALRGHS